MRNKELMKRAFIFFSIIVISILAFSFDAKEGINAQSMESIYDIKINRLNGEALNLNDFRGKKLLIVNVASECGFTPQYEDLQTLSENYKDKLVVIGIPCNQFGEQEPGSPDEIMEFCQNTYGVTFILTEKVDVKGDNQHPLYVWLTQKKKNGAKNSKVKWNFQKYLIDKKGFLYFVIHPRTSPTNDSIIKWIERE
jgi:glutathione peroxidase